jgi:hypothetical protein
MVRHLHGLRADLVEGALEVVLVYLLALQLVSILLWGQRLLVSMLLRNSMQFARILLKLMFYCPVPESNPGGQVMLRAGDIQIHYQTQAI